jgi:hypothetical protein
MDALDREHMRLDCLDQRHQRRCRGANPVGELSGIEIDAFVGIGCALAVERQMQAVVIFENSILSLLETPKPKGIQEFLRT